MRSDLAETTTKQHVHQRLRELEERISKADQYYRDGVSELEACEYVKAQVAFREVENLVPDGYKDVTEQLDKVQEKREQLGSLRQEVSYELGEIERGSFTLASAVEALQHAESLRAISAQPGRTKLDLQLVKTCTVLFDSQANALRKLPPGDAQASFEFIDNNFTPLVETLPVERWTVLVEQDAELCRAACSVLTTGYETIGPASPDLEIELRRAQRFTDLLARMKGLGPALKPPLGSTHPCELVGNSIVESFQQSRRAQQELHLNAAVLTLGELAESAPTDVAGRLRDRVVELQSWGRRAAVQSWVRRGVTVAKVGGPFLAALVVGLVAGIFLGRAGARQGAEEEWARLSARIGFDDSLSASLRPLIESEGADAVGFRFFSGWAAMRDRLEGGTTDAAVWAADLRLAAHPMAGRLPKDLQRAFRTDAERALARALTGIFLESARTPSGDTTTALARLGALLPQPAESNATLDQLRSLLVDGPRSVAGRIGELSASLRIDRRAQATGPGLQVRGHLDNIKGLSLGEELDEARSAGQRWLRCVLRERVIEALALRVAEASLGDLSGYLGWTAELLDACDGFELQDPPAPKGGNALAQAAREAVALVGG